jgi:DNA-binding beta-propeller fold protein YncE
MGLPFGVPPAPEDPVLARVAPEDCLGYASWAGVAAPDPKSPNQTEQLLAEPEVQNFFVQIDRALRQMVEKHLADQKVEDKQTVRDVMEAWRSVATHPGAIFLSKLELKKAPPDKKPKTAKNDQPTAEATADSFKDVAEIELGVVLSLGADAPRMEAILNKYVETCRRTAKEKAAKSKTPDKGPAAAKHDGNAPRADSDIETLKIGDRNGYRVRLDEPAGHCWTCGFHDGYFLLTLGREDAARRVLECMKAAPPRWWAAFREQVPVQRRSLVAYANPRRWGDLVLSHADSTARANARMIVELLGLTNATSLAEVWGLDGDTFVNKTFLALEGEPRGLLRLISDRPLKPEDFSPIPRDAGFAMAFHLDLQQALDITLAAVEKANPQSKKDFLQTLDEFERAIHVDLRHGVLQSFGDTWRVYSSFSEGNLDTVIVPLRDGAALKLAYGRLMGLLKERLQPPKQSGTAAKDNATLDLSNFPTRMEQFEFEGRLIYCFNSGGVAPSWCLNDHEMIVGFSPQAVKAYLTRGNRYEPMSRDPRLAGLLSGAHAPTALIYWDPQGICRFCYSCLMWCAPAITNGLRGAGADVDLSLFPSMPAIDRHLVRSVSTVRRTPHGIEFAGRGTIPLPIDAATLTAMSMMSQFQTFLAAFGFGGDNPPEAQPVFNKAQPTVNPEPKNSMPAVETIKPTRTLRTNGGRVGSLTFSPDGKLLASGDWDDAIKLWDMATDKTVATFRGNFGPAASVMFSPDGKVLVLADQLELNLWNIDTGMKIVTLTEPSHALLVSAKLSPDGRTLASARQGNKINLWDVASGKVSATLEGESTTEPTSIAFSPDGKMLAVGTGKAEGGAAAAGVTLWDVGSRKKTAQFKGHTGPVASVAFSPDGKLLASGSNDGTVKLWDAATGKNTTTLKVDGVGVTGMEAVAFSPDGKTLAAASSGGALNLWDVRAQTWTAILTGDFGESFVAVAFSPDGKVVAAGTLEDKIELWDLKPHK